jgi:hypothetical protein
MSQSAMLNKGIEHPHVGFRWQSGDNNTELWYPQGITGLRRGSGKKFVSVTWYGKESYQNKGVRLSLVDVTDMDDVRYRHVLLVQPSSGATQPIFGPILIHAGGLATRNSTIYVADTSVGVRVFDTTKMFRAEADSGKSMCGVHGGKAFAFDYRLILPQVGCYRLGGPPKFSFASMDWTAKTSPKLLMGNYDLEPPTLSWWKMSGLRITSGFKQITHPHERVQGAAALDDSVFLSCSGSNAKLNVAKDPYSTWTSHSWPHGCEDLHLSPNSDNLWCLTEHPQERFVFTVKRVDYVS